MKIIPIPARDPNSKPNASFVALLKGGLDDLWNGRKGKHSAGSKSFICNTFWMVVDSAPLHRLIAVRMGKYATFGQWLRQFGRFTTKQVQDGRKAWMLDLIEEFSVAVTKPKAKIPAIPPRDPKSEPNREFVGALKRGLKGLWDGMGEKGSEFICHTLDNADLRDLIEQRLIWGTTYQDWANKGKHQFTMVEIQAGRRRWMLDLIEEFSNRSG